VPNQRFAALDTYFLLELEKGNPTYEGVIDALSAIGIFFLVTDTVLQELADIEFCSPKPEVQRLAADTIKRLGLKGIITPPLPAVSRGVAEIIAQNLATLVKDGDKDDGLVLAEAACHNCRMLVTTRQTILDGDTEAIRMALIRSDVGDLVAISPEAILEIFERLDALRKHHTPHPPSSGA